MNARLQTYLRNWNLSEPKLIASTFTADVYRVINSEDDAVLKVFNDKGQKFESKGASVLNCFAGHGAVRLLNADAGAHLLEYIDGPHLKKLVAEGRDDEATLVVCDVVAKLHSYSGDIPKGLISMTRNFRSLFEKAKTEPRDSIYSVGASLAESLIANPQDVRVLHGDIHHENIVKSSTRGWLAIDPQCLVGERTYDVANTFYNPIDFPKLKEIDEIERRCRIFETRLELERTRILEYAFVYGCLSASWSLADGQSAASTLVTANSILQMLNA